MGIRVGKNVRKQREGKEMVNVHGLPYVNVCKHRFGLIFINAPQNVCVSDCKHIDALNLSCFAETYMPHCRI